MESKRIAGGLVAFVGIALANEWIVRVFDMALTRVYNSGSLDWGVFQNLLGIISLMAGIYFLIRPSDRASKERDRLRLVRNINNLKRDIEIEGNNLSDASHLFGEMVSVYFSLDRLGILTPSTTVSDRETLFKQCYTYLTNIAPLIRDGHLADAKREAPRIIERIPADPDRMLRGRNRFSIFRRKPKELPVT